MADKTHLILTPNQILFRVTGAMIVSLIVLTALVFATGEPSSIEPDLLAIDS